MAKDSLKNDWSQEIERLNRDARALLSISISTPEIIEQFEAYVQHVDTWVASMSTDLPHALATETGHAFLSLHQQVLAHAEQASGAVAQQLKTHMKRGKGILAYTDILPRQMGVTRPRKG